MEELEQIRAAVRAGVSKADLARVSGVARRVLNDLDSPEFNPRIKTLEALAQAAKKLCADQEEKVRRKLDALEAVNNGE